MTALDFTVEEINMIAIYKADTKTATMKQIAAAYPHMDIDMRAIVEGASRKLAMLTEPEFSEIAFTPADDDNEV